MPQSKVSFQSLSDTVTPTRAFPAFALLSFINKNGLTKQMPDEIETVTTNRLINRETDRQTDRQTDRESVRQMER